MDFREFLKRNTVYLDGGMGTLLQSRGLKAGEEPERWNISHPEEIIDIQKAYYDAGSNVICSNTFGANLLKFSADELEMLIKAALDNARAARERSSGKQEKFVALDIGPCGKLLAPLGDLAFERAVEIFAQTVRLGVKHGAELIVIETMNDAYETKAALLAAKENSDLPIIVTNAYGADGKLMTGATPSAMVALLEGVGVLALGANCSLGPKQLAGVAEELLRYASVPVVLKPNAGLPRVVDGKTVFDVGADEFARELELLVRKGVRVVGGCCGTTPEYISALVEKTSGIFPVEITKKQETLVSSYTHAVGFGDSPILIGERINPTGKKKFRQALIDNDMDHILAEGVEQAERGVHILDVNVGIPDIDEPAMLEKCVRELQAVTDLPLQIDTSDPIAMEAALRVYNGKAMINSVSGKIESMHAVFPLVKKYGGVVVALTLDENGIPGDARGRVEIAKRILSVANEYGIDKKDIIFDTLALTVSADPHAAKETLAALRCIRNELGCYTSLGVSNVSFGLPNRDAINSSFFTMALTSGLSAAIMNPYSTDMMRSYYTYKALAGLDENCAEYVSVANSFTTATAPSITSASTAESYASELQRAVIKGLCDKAAELTQKMLETARPLEIVNGEIIPALDRVGEGFEKKTVYLPQLLMSAEAAKNAFECIKKHMASNGATETKATFILATVKGDIHDIGKNIVKLLLENYGFEVIDLGKDVAPEAVVEAAQRTHAEFVGLSALMTTTVPAMEETIKQLKASAPWTKVFVGGAVMTAEYAERIGADVYAKDAMEAVRAAEELLKGK